MAHRGSSTERHDAASDAPGSAVGKDSERPYTKHSNMSFAGNLNLATVYNKEEATVVAYFVQLQNHAIAYLCPVSSSQDLAVFAALISGTNSERLLNASQDCHQPVKRASSVRCINQR